MQITKAQLRVFSAVSTNLCVIWLAALFTTRNPIVLTANIIYATIFWKLAVRAEEYLEEL